MVLDVRKRQKDALTKLLHLNETAKRDASAVEAFKVLVIDDASLKIVATLLHTEALRQHGVTLVLAIDREREAIADAPVVYFVRSTQANAAAIVKDLEGGLYKEAHVNFVSWAPREVLETLAAGTVKAAATATVARVFDQYLSFIALEADLFTLSLADSYVHLNDNTASEAAVAAAVSDVVEGLFSVCVTLAAVPRIRCVPGGLAEAVARALSAKIAGHLRGRGPSLFADAQSFMAAAARPLLCLFDRNFDLTPMVEQPFTYKALVHDCQGLALNKVELEQGGGGEGGGAAGRKVTVEIGDDDAFWQQNGHQEFGIVASSIDEQLKKYQEVMTSLSKRNFAGDAEASEADAVQEATRALMTTVKSLPELRAQKRKLDNHMNLLYGLLKAIKERTLDKYHELGQALLSGSAGSAEVRAKLAEGAGSAADKLRLATLYLLVAERPPAAADTQALAEALREAGADEAAFNYVVRMKQMNLTGGGAGGAAAPAAGGSKGWAMPGIDASLVSGIAGQFSKQLTKLVGGTRQAQLVTAVSQLLDGGGGRGSSSAPTPADTFLLLDPKQEAGKGSDDGGHTSAREAIVFMIGGGNYLERERLAQWAAQCSPRRRVVYGATELLTGEQFCAQLALLGRKSVGTAA